MIYIYTTVLEVEGMGGWRYKLLISPPKAPHSHSLALKICFAPSDWSPVFDRMKDRLYRIEK